MIGKRSIFFRFSKRLRTLKNLQAECEKLHQELLTHQKTHKPTKS